MFHLFIKGCCNRLVFELLRGMLGDNRKDDRRAGPNEGLDVLL